MRCFPRLLLCTAILVSPPTAKAIAQDNSTANPAPSAPNASAANPAPSAPSSLVLYFDPGSSVIRQKDVPLLDQASRLYRAGHPIVMVVTGGADTTGTPGENLKLSQQRANTVLQGLVSRGIPVERFQVMAKGETDLVAPTPPGVSEERNRRVEITWR